MRREHRRDFRWEDCLVRRRKGREKGWAIGLTKFLSLDLRRKWGEERGLDGKLPTLPYLLPSKLLLFCLCFLKT